MTKYKAQKITVGDISFDSKAEAEYYTLLLKEVKRGKITDIELQPTFTLQEGYRHNGKAVKAITYVADFKYIDVETGETIVVDVKGMATEVANIKRKMFNYLYGAEMSLMWVVKNNKYGTNGWCCYDKLKKCRRDAKKKK